jgi:hypothetical protein
VCSSDLFVSLTANTSSVNEGNLVQFTLVTANAVNGSTLFYSVNPVTANLTISDFYNGSNTGYLTLNNNQAVFALYANTDSGYVDETGETFRVQLRTDSITGNVVYASTSNVVIIDTNKLYNVIGFTENASSVTEGGTITLTFTAHNVPAGTVLYYSTDGNTTSSTFASANTGSFVMNGLSNTISLVTASVPYGITQNFNVKIREGSPTGTLLATSNNIIAIDSALISYISATGGNVTTSNGYRVHTFTTSGNLTVSALGFAPGNFFDYLVVAGGGGATTYSGAGAGGFRTGSGLSVIQGTYAITVGAGGSGTNTPVGTYGSDSIFSTITSTGGGRGVSDGAGGNGGSGGGGYGGLSPGSAGGLGNTPSTSPPQGNNGGRGLTDNINYTASGGGGGAGAVGGNAAYQAGGNGGSGAPSSISGSNVMYAGGGGGRSNAGPSGSGGTGGGGPATNTGVGTPGTINTGGGGGGGGLSPGGSGGSGIIIVRYPYVEPATISNVVTTATAFIVGSNITFTINATNANLTTLYYTTDGNVDSSYFIGGNTGSFVANASGGIVTLLGNTNATVPVGQTRNFRLQIRQDSTTGFISGSSSNVALLNSADFYINATGGSNVFVSDGYKIHTFNTSSTLNVTSIGGTGAIEYLVVAGGGAGGGYYGGGGGAGGVLTGSTTISSTGNITVVVGGGGATAYARGSNSSISVNQIVSSGGGGSQGPGGSGGGGSGGDDYAGGVGTTGQGFPGGNTAWSTPGPSTGSGGGGGAGQAGASGGFGDGFGGRGGNGISVSWVTPSYGTNGPTPGRWFGGGGGASNYQPYSLNGIGGAGGGGDGGKYNPPTGTSSAGMNGNVFTGGGGGGRSGTANPTSSPIAGTGGSGIVIIRYPYS